MKENHFTIVIPAYNCGPWVNRNLNSALGQNYKNFDVVYIDDASTDDTSAIAKDLLNTSEKKFKLVINNINVKALCNLDSEISKAREDSIIVTLDGDDCLMDDNVLSYLNSVYQDEQVWMTAGSYVDNVTYQVVSPQVSEDYWTKNIRNQNWSFSHLRTFKKKLFDRIRKQDLMDVDGDYFKFTFDRAMMYPMVEMSGPDHVKLIHKVLYVYNRLNPISVDRVHRSEQLRIESHIRAMKPYERVQAL